MTRAFRLGLGALLLGGLPLRLAFLLTPHGTLDGDEAIVGLMGRHILQGEFPVFSYGQGNMGGWGPTWLVWPFSSSVPPPLTLKGVPLALSLAFWPSPWSWAAGS